MAGMNNIIDSLRKAWNIAINPSKATSMSIKDALIFYYSFAIIPVIITAILAGVFTNTGLLGAVLEIVSALVLSPIAFFIVAALIHLFGKFLFRKFQKPYVATFTAVVLAAIPSTIFSWLLIITSISVPVSIVATIIVDIWAVIILTIAIMQLQKTSGIIAVLSWLAPVIILLIIAIIIGIVAAALLTSVIPSIGGFPVQNGTLNSTFNITTTI